MNHAKTYFATALLVICVAANPSVAAAQEGGEDVEEECTVYGEQTADATVYWCEFDDGTVKWAWIHSSTTSDGGFTISHTGASDYNASGPPINDRGRTSGSGGNPVGFWERAVSAVGSASETDASVIGRCCIR